MTTDKLSVSIEELIERGVQERFFKTFGGCPIVFSNTSDKKLVVAKLLQDQKPAYPFAIAVFTTFAAPSGPTSLKPHALMRRGVTGQTTHDQIGTYKLSLLPMDSTYEISYFTNDFNAVKKFAKDWMFAAQAASLNTTVTYGVLDLDVRVEMEKTGSIPQREANPTDIPEYVVVMNFTIQGMVSRDKMEDVQAAVQMDTTVDLTSDPLDQNAANQQIYLWSSPWTNVAGPAASTGDTKNALITE